MSEITKLIMMLRDVEADMDTIDGTPHGKVGKLLDKITGKVFAAMTWAEIIAAEEAGRAA